MSTRALQDSMMLLGYRDPTTDEWLAAGTVEFYSAGTLNAKNAWSDKDKAAAITSVTLDSSGQAQVYLDGVYKFIVKNAAGTTRYTLDNLKFQARNTSTLTKTANYQATADDDYLLCNTDGGAFTITMAAVAGVVAPITIKNTGSSGNDVTVDGSGSETIDGSATGTLSDAASQQFVTDGVQWYGAGAATGTNFTSATLMFGDGLTSSTGAGVTTATFDISDTNITKDEDDMSSDSTTHLATQQSIKAYVDTTAAASGIVQIQRTDDGEAATGATQLPIAFTVPQNTEGDEYITVTVTPTSATNILIIDAHLLLSNSAVKVAIALFQDTTSGALSASAGGSIVSGALSDISLSHKMTAGTTSATTFKIRAGGTGAGTTTFNGEGGIRAFGGVSNSYISVTEISA